MLPRLPWIIQWAILVFALFGLFVAFGFVEIAAVAMLSECSRRLRFRREHKARRRSASLAAGPESPPRRTLRDYYGEMTLDDVILFPATYPPYPGLHSGTGFFGHVHHWTWYTFGGADVEACEYCGWPKDA